MKLGWNPAVDNIKLNEPIHCNINKIKLEGIHLNDLYKIAKNIPSISHICSKVVSYSRNSPTMLCCPNVKILHIHNSWCDNNSISKIFDTLKSAFMNITTILLPLSTKSMSLKWITDNYKEIKIIIYESDSSCNIFKCLDKMLKDCENIIQYITINNYVLYHNHRELLKYSGRIQAKFYIYLK